MSDLVEVVAVAGPRGPIREPLRARLLAGGAAGEAVALCTDDPAWGMGCECCELRGALLAAVTRIVADPAVRRLLIDVGDGTELGEVVSVLRSPMLSRVLEFVGTVGLVREEELSRASAARPLVRLRRAGLILVQGRAPFVTRVREECQEARVLPIDDSLEVVARVLSGGSCGGGHEVVRSRPVRLAGLEAWLDALPDEVVRVDGDALVLEWPSRRAVVRKLGGRSEIRSLPRDGLAETRLWAVSTRDGVALKEL
ncbi:hypothetical protein SAMN02745121_06275 [Nannocystis exedens]|uniref:Uncharacterized protein n=1 Tax=Nannocystis exedens TaxID=54 RepID=A0A1I2EXE0_9BACT|nr:hypothetical protein [Nannocystis exedens]PCC69465.1 hypothetical protein NAEX_02487 [Nannocystis exedens]SFE96971.1 hypothetical protein SAMN02745121_06275 [Nannocystis exedens]